MTTSGAESVQRLVLDTSAYVAMCRGNDQVLDWVAAADTIILSATVLGELEAGFELGRAGAAQRVALTDFLGEPFVLELPLTRTTARHYGRLFADLRRAGTPLPVNDIWIVAATLDCGGHLLTLDRDFGRMQAVHTTVLEHS